MKILVVNCGSSSLKYQLLDMVDESVIAKGLVERIGLETGHLNQKCKGQVIDIVAPVADHVQATEMMLAALQDSEKGAIKSMDEIGAVGHRVLHGGTEFCESVVIDEKVKAAIRRCIPLGPLHNPANLMGIEACEKVMPTTPQIAVFDTAFHQTMPPKAYMYGVPKEYLEKYGVRRYGFHGTSHRYVSKRVCEYLGVSPIGQRIIVCHLGNGSSLSAVVDGKCVDTTMGLTPLEGVIMGTRSGSCDPAVVQFIANNEGWTVDQTLNMMNKKSGLLGISGYSSDLRDVDAKAAEGDADCKLAQDMLVYGIVKYIGGYVAAMGGVDVIVFTAGIGENNELLRERVLDHFGYLGVEYDKELNNKVHNPNHPGETTLSTENSKVKVVVIPTNEELTIARDTLDLIK